MPFINNNATGAYVFRDGIAWLLQAGASKFLTSSILIAMVMVLRFGLQQVKLVELKNIHVEGNNKIVIQVFKEKSR